MGEQPLPGREMDSTAQNSAAQDEDRGAIGSKLRRVDQRSSVSGDEDTSTLAPLSQDSVASSPILTDGTFLDQRAVHGRDVHLSQPALEAGRVL